MDILSTENDNQEQAKGNETNQNSTINVESSSNCEQISYQYPPLFINNAVKELSKSSWFSPSGTAIEVQPYLRGCKWSPDGQFCLSVVNSDGVHVTEFPRDLYWNAPVPDRAIDVLDSYKHVKEAGLVYDFCWYPGMNSLCPETCCWLTTMQNTPIQIWNVFDGSLKATYRGFNAVDEMEPAVSVTFSFDGTQIIGGYKKALRTFDINRPGRDYREYKTKSPASCFATDSNYMAVGSWDTTIDLYNSNAYKPIGKMRGHSGGITHMKFTPDGQRLVSGARKDDKLLVWDLRYYRWPINILKRVVDTNQRIYFDISPCGKYVVSGGTDGILKVWNVDTVDWTANQDPTDKSDKYSYKFPIHKDCCNSVSIHPLRPVLATGSGQYHFKDPTKSDEGQLDNEETIENEDQVDVNAEESKMISYGVDKYSNNSENNLMFWWIGEIPDLT